MENQKLTLEQQIDYIWNNIKGFHLVHLIYTGHKLGIFDLFIDNKNEVGLTIKQISDLKKLDFDYIEKWCFCAIAWKILDDKEGDRLQLSEHMDAILGKPGDPRYLLPYITACIEHFGPDMKEHYKYIKSGGIFKFQEHGNEFSRSIGEITEGLQTLMVRRILPNLESVNKVLTRGGNLLDVGCGTAKLLIKAQNLFPKSKFYGLDIDKEGIAIANENITKCKLKDNISILNFDEDTLPEDSTMDVVTLVEVLHEIPRVDRLKVFKTIYKLMKKNGTLVILDETMPVRKDLRISEYSLAIQTQYNEMTWGNVVPNAEEQDKLLSNSGFVNINRSNIGGYFTLLVAHPN